MSGRKPMSSMRSASSSTTNVSFEKSTVPRARWSSTRPGVPTMICAPAAEFFDLLADRLAAIDGDAVDAAAFGQLDDFVLHLHGQFPRRHHDQGLRVVDVVA